MIQAKVIADNIGQFGDRLTTLEIVMPRYILAEFNTHRMLSKNSASSRAIPLQKMIDSVRENPFIPYAWQKEHSGMQGTEYLDELSANDLDDDWIEKITAKELLDDFWSGKSNISGNLSAMDYALGEAENLGNHKVTKQLANRLLEPFMYHKVLVSGTEWENFFNLRCPQYSLVDNNGNKVNRYAKSRKEWCNLMSTYTNTIYESKDYTVLEWLKINKGQADIHMMFLAEAIYDAMNESKPNELKEGEWHIPYGDNIDDEILIQYCIDNDIIPSDVVINDLTLKISVARCARLSYQTLGDNPEINYEKDLQLYEILSKSGHWSPFEHIAKGMSEEEYYSFVKGKVIAVDNLIVGDKKYFGWCNNFKGFIQQRYILEQDYV